MSLNNFPEAFGVRLYKGDRNKFKKLKRKIRLKNIWAAFFIRPSTKFSRGWPKCGYEVNEEFFVIFLVESSVLITKTDSFRKWGNKKKKKMVKKIIHDTSGEFYDFRVKIIMNIILVLHTYVVYIIYKVMCDPLNRLFYVNI